MAKKKGNNQVELLDDNFAALFDEEDQEVLKVLEATIKKFENENFDTKLINPEDFMDDVAPLNLSDDALELSLNRFKNDGFEIMSDASDMEQDFDEAKLAEMEEEDLDSDFDEGAIDEYEKEALNIDTENFNFDTTDVKINDSVKLYLKDIGKVNLLKPNEEQELAKRILQGDQYARNQLINANLRLVVSIAKHYIGRVCSF